MPFYVTAILAAIALGICAALLRRELKRRNEKKQAEEGVKDDSK